MYNKIRDTKTSSSRANFRMKCNTVVSNTFVDESRHKLCNGIADQIGHGPRPVYSGYTIVLSDRVPSGFAASAGAGGLTLMVVFAFVSYYLLTVKISRLLWLILPLWYALWNHRLLLSLSKLQRVIYANDDSACISIAWWIKHWILYCSHKVGAHIIFYSS